jgi:hypothetical protein
MATLDCKLDGDIFCNGTSVNTLKTRTPELRVVIGKSIFGSLKTPRISCYPCIVTTCVTEMKTTEWDEILYNEYTKWHAF